MSRHIFSAGVLSSAKVWAAACICVLASLVMTAPAKAQLAPGACTVTSAMAPVYEIDGLEITQDTRLGTVPATGAFSITCGATSSDIDISVLSDGEATNSAGTLLYKLCPTSPSFSCASPFSTQFPGGTPWTTIPPGSGDVTVEFTFVPVLPAQPTPNVSQAPYVDTLTVTYTGTSPGSTPVPFQVQAQSACIFGSTPGAAAPTYKLLFGLGGGTTTADTNAAGVMQITCSGGGHYSITANEGANFDSTGSTRRMRLSGATDCTGIGDCLDYKLLMNAPGATIAEWGGTATQPNGAAAIEGLASGATQAIPFYGLVPGQQALKSGTYGDLVQLTIEFDQ